MTKFWVLCAALGMTAIECRADLAEAGALYGLAEVLALHFYASPRTHFRRGGIGCISDGVAEGKFADGAPLHQPSISPARSNPASMVGSVVRASEFSLLLLVATSQA